MKIDILAAQRSFFAASNSAYYGYPELWILKYPAHRYNAVPSPGFEPTTTLCLRVRHPNDSATMLQISCKSNPFSVA
jgi:hypothetical protein